MPRNGQGVYSLPPNTAAVTGQTIASAPYNTVNNDLANDLNAARPITSGGTGATNAADALDNLGGVGQTNFLSAYSIGDFYETVRNIAAVDGVWLRRNGALYDSATYPTLATLLPALSDAVEWSTLNVFISGDGRTVIATPTGFMLLNDDGTNTKVYTTTDGTNWSVISTIPGFRAYDVVRGGGVYVAVDGTGYASVSNDGVTWSSPATINTMTSVQGVTYGNSLFVAGGDAGKISTSPDGVTWTARTSGTSEFLWRVRYVNSTFIATGSNGTIISSTNGTSWTLRTSGVTNVIWDVTFGAGIYVFVGSAGLILTTPNLTGFTPRTSGTSSTLYSVVYSSAGFALVGASGVARISTAGTSWVSTPTGVGFNLVYMIVDPNNPARYYATGNGAVTGLRTLPTQFRVPNDDPTYGWIKAEDAA